MWSGILTDEVDGVWKYNNSPLFQNLTSLTVFFCGIKFRLFSVGPREYKLQRAIFKFLSSAPKLKNLSLGLDCEDPSDVGADDLSLAKIFGDVYVWKHLETFFLNAGPRIWPAQELMFFWARHSATLKTFGLYHLHLERGFTWRDVFDFITQWVSGRCLENLFILQPSEVTPGGSRGFWKLGDYRDRINEIQRLKTLYLKMTMARLFVTLQMTDIVRRP
ncbi:hypothetical protein RUND412_003922 [Rhizina undulata]